MLEKGKNMKKITYAIIVAAILLFSGCNSMHFFVIDDTNKDKETVTGAFNDETYIWESWSYSTNQVNEVK